MAIHPWLKVVGLFAATTGALYATVLLLLLNVSLQRHALYAHRIKPWWQDLDQPEQWGFLKNQVRPFKIRTPDGEELYAWHILPIALYAKSEGDLVLDPMGSDQDVTKTTAFHLLKDDPESRLVVSFHGVAGTVGQGWRTDTYRALSAGAAHKIHVLTVDYRGFGYSSGRPSEEGLITDGIALVDWALQVAGIPSERIVILGQSLGAAVTTAVVEHYIEQSTVGFAGVVLVAAFSKIPELMLTYAAGSIVPILSPLRIFPRLQEYIAHRAKDTWNTEERLVNIIRQRGNLNLVLIHAINDYDIPWTHSNTLFYAAAKATSEETLSNDMVDNYKHHTDLGRQGWTNNWPATWGQNGMKTVQQIILRDGGHNRLMTYAPVTKAVFELFGL